MLSFRTVLHSFKSLKRFLGTTLASVDKTLMSPKLNSQFQTGNSCTDAGNGGYGSCSWDPIHNLVATGVAWTKDLLPKKLWVIFRPPNSYCLGLHLLTSFLLWLNCPLQSLFMPRACQCLVSSLFFCVCREQFWWDQPQEQLASKHHDCSAKRYDNKKSEDDMKPVIMMNFSCMNNYWFCIEIDSL